MRWHRNASVSSGIYNRDDTFLFSIKWRVFLAVFYIEEPYTAWFRYDTVFFFYPKRPQWTRLTCQCAIRRLCCSWWRQQMDIFSTLLTLFSVKAIFSSSPTRKNRFLKYIILSQSPSSIMFEAMLYYQWFRGVILGEPQAMKDGVTLKRRLPLAGCKPRISPGFIIRCISLRGNVE